MILHLRGGQMELFGGFYVRDLLEKVHQLREVEEFCEPGPGAVAGSFRSQFQNGGRFPKPAGPAVEVAHAHLLQPVILKVAVDGKHFGHGIGDRSPCGENDAAPAGDLVQVAALGKHIAGFLGVGSRQTGDIPHFRCQEQIFIKIALVHKHPVHAQLFKGDNTVLFIPCT